MLKDRGGERVPASIAGMRNSRQARNAPKMMSEGTKNIFMQKAFLRSEWQGRAVVEIGKHNYDDYGEKCLQQIMNLQTKNVAAEGSQSRPDASTKRF